VSNDNVNTPPSLSTTVDLQARIAGAVAKVAPDKLRHTWK
jgi:hypothetical protein